MRKPLSIALLLFIWACASSDPHPAIVATEEKLISDCEYLDTLSEISDPGRCLPKYQENDAALNILKRADRLGATHIVWIYNYKKLGSAALAYRCEQLK